MAYNSFSSFTSMGLFYLILKGELNLLLKNKEYSDLREIRENESSYGIEDDLMPEISNYTIDTLPYEPLLSLKEGYKTHKKGEAWKCYGYYLFECINGEIDKEKGINLLKESADAGDYIFYILMENLTLKKMLNRGYDT
ncbi:hypothetical protein RhiirA5_486721 [Rhizophagus irregularis]|uniref:Uncharacterized protein n=1 Tax=Rhizophagus irregularis TaxID=588596 RepID=A0A2I1DWT7_9GLOM|nr:hypothetical protein RhiirA5_486721 [Rhizophagus irregularis]PKC62096.1 hypothetical protein RhiirA1_444091 [Rhizophagus irregularis]PKY14348.1 hypothetical protein RhiirB3_466016 [Rhizophagus irregularis]